MSPNNVPPVKLPPMKDFVDAALEWSMPRTEAILRDSVNKHGAECVRLLDRNFAIPTPRSQAPISPLMTIGYGNAYTVNSSPPLKDSLLNTPVMLDRRSVNGDAGVSSSYGSLLDSSSEGD
ncbi:hypothetical protein NUW58_g9765 [Xylaria curta]|uniref:Uncharacterized protein n=1 Tax=Xylaria curta TaxID=42375 RepID=A0ACC1MVJ5_9PEZI|nr:hypothetical protein NUW58_g9765 [Xylaria curta]